MSEQIAIRIPAEVASALERLVDSGRFKTKADAVRTALQDLVDEERRNEIGAKIAAGYQRVPQTDDEVAAATDAALRSIREEPW